MIWRRLRLESAILTYFYPFLSGVEYIHLKGQKTAKCKNKLRFWQDSLCEYTRLSQPIFVKAGRQVI